MKTDSRLTVHGMDGPVRLEQKTSPPVIVGVDIGQRVDPTAICVAEAFKHDQPGRWEEYEFYARFLERLALGTSYPLVAQRIATVVQRIQARPRNPNLRAPQVFVVVDATGVGTPVVDILREEMDRQGIKIKVTEAFFTHGDRLNGRVGQTRMTVGKAFLVSRLQSLFQTSRVFLPPDHPEAEAMARELQDYEIKVSENANDQYGAFKVGAHDDLVTALGLSVLCDPPKPKIIYGF